MQELIELASELETPLKPPATKAQLKDLEDMLKYPIPEQVRTFYLTTNGLDSTHAVQYPLPLIMSIDAIKAFLTSVAGTWDMRYLPLVKGSDMDSNYYCVRCDDLLKGYVVYVQLYQSRYFDGTEIRFRNFGSFMKTLAKYYHSDVTGSKGVAPLEIEIFHRNLIN